ncbi:unnamed protein product [Musa acuminata subsp. burmannicoides]
MATYKSNLLLFLFFVLVTIDLSTSARNLDHKTTTSPATDQTITFIMNDVLGRRHSGAPLRSPQPMSVDLGRTPFRDQTGPASGWLPILASAPALQAGTVTAVDEELAGNVELGSPLSGKAQGIYVTSVEDKSSHIVAMRVTFAGGRGETGDSLSLFGVHQPAQAESHIAVVGGTGRYRDANGIAILQAVASKSSSERESMQHKVLSVHVYLKTHKKRQPEEKRYLMLGETVADGTSLLGAEIERDELLVLVGLPQRLLLLLRDHGAESRNKMRTNKRTTDQGGEDPSHLGELVGCATGDFGDAEEGKLVLEVLQLGLELRLGLPPKLVNLNPRYTQQITLHNQSKRVALTFRKEFLTHRDRIASPPSSLSSPSASAARKP